MMLPRFTIQYSTVDLVCGGGPNKGPRLPAAEGQSGTMRAPDLQKLEAEGRRRNALYRGINKARDG
jgi:hypothetical protein